MKSVVQTRIFVSLTPEEARAAVNNAIDLQLCVRSALYQIDGAPVAVQIQDVRKQITAPKRNGAGKAARKNKAQKIECTQCHKLFDVRGMGKHMTSKHKPAPQEHVAELAGATKEN